MVKKMKKILETDSKHWWSNHSQDYVDPGETAHQGVDPQMPEKSFLELLDKIDRNFIYQAYFAQGPGESLFFGLMPVEWLKGKKVLEVGCGLGAHSEALIRAGAVLTSIDLSPTSVAVTKRRLKLRNLFAEVREADAENLPFEPNTYDYIWSWGVIHHSPDTVKCAREMARVLKPGGRVGIMLYHDHSLYNWLNVIFRYGVLQGKLLKMSVRDLHNRYTDGKYVGGCPLAKYYTRKQIARELFPGFKVGRQIAFEQKKAISFIVPAKYRRAFEHRIPDKLYTWLFSRLGFLLFTDAWKPKQGVER